MISIDEAIEFCEATVKNQKLLAGDNPPKCVIESIEIFSAMAQWLRELKAIKGERSE